MVGIALRVPGPSDDKQRLLVRPATAGANGRRTPFQARPATAGGNIGSHKASTLARSSSMPVMKKLMSEHVTRPGSAGYRSKAVELEVRLREQLAESGVQGDGFAFPNTRLGAGDMARGDVDVGVVTAPKLQVYRDLFEAIIDADDAFAPLLRKVKTIYDACAEPLLEGEPRQERATTPRGEEIDGVRDVIVAGSAERLTELGLENRLLRTMAGRLYHERSELRQEREAAEAHRKQKQIASTDPAAGEDWVALAGLLPMGGGLACQNGLRRGTSQSRPFSAMRVTSHGIRTDQVW